MTLAQQDGVWQVGARDFPTNKGGMCRKGWTAAALLRSPDRLTRPLVRDRRGMHLREASWDEALARVASGMQAIQARHGRDAMAVFGGGGLTNEKAYLLGKFARVALGTANIDYNGRFCMAASAAAGQKAFGIDRGLPFPLEDIPGAEVILLPGGNPAETMPPIMQYFEAQKARGGKLIVADPRRTRRRRGGRPASATEPGHGCGAGQRAAARRHARQADRHRLHRRAHERVRGGAPGLQRLLAGPGRAHHRGAGGRYRARRAHAGRGSDGHGADRARHRAAVARHRQCARLHQSAAGPRARRPAAQRLSGRSPARATARAAASMGRRPTSCRATASSPIRRRARMSPASGA